MPTPAMLAIAAGFAAAAAILLALWAVLCGSWCGLLIILWQTAIVGGWVALYISGCCSWLRWVGFGLIGVASGGFVAWVRVCDPARCAIWRELAWAFSVALGTALDVLSFVPCGESWVVATAGVIAAGFVTVALLCGRGERTDFSTRLPIARARSRRRPCGCR